MHPSTDINNTWAHDRYKTGENVWVSVNIFYDFLVDLAIKKLVEGKFVCNLGPFRIKISTHSLLTILTHRCVLIIQTLPPTRELKIEKGQKKECRMVNLRFCKTTRPRFQTLRPRLKTIWDSEMQNHPKKRLRDKHVWDFVIWPKFEEPFYTPKRGLITPVHEALKILCCLKCNYLFQYLVNNQIKGKR